MQGYCWLKIRKGHCQKNSHQETLPPISLHYKVGPYLQNEGAILKIKGQFCPRPLPKLSLGNGNDYFSKKGVMVMVMVMKKMQCNGNVIHYFKK